MEATVQSTVPEPRPETLILDCNVDDVKTIILTHVSRGKKNGAIYCERNYKIRMDRQTDTSSKEKFVDLGGQHSSVDPLAPTHLRAPRSNPKHSIYTFFNL